MGLETSDDAGVLRLSHDLALVETVDIVTPLVDDPFTFGRIAAANALSDVYAMGGKPVTVMNLVFFPACSLAGEVLGEILAGGQSAIRESGACLVGGHTVEDDELKYGLSVTGTIHPDRIVRNSTARAGNRLILTKPLGTGIISTAIKADFASAEDVAEAVQWMAMLNAAAAGLMVEKGASAATDVTGFGLVGHAYEMARGAGVTFQLEAASIPLMNSVSALIDNGMIPAGCYRNRDFYLPRVHSDLSADNLLPLFDPQTSGGLLISLSPEAAAGFLVSACERGLFAVAVGEVLPFAEHHVRIV